MSSKIVPRKHDLWNKKRKAQIVIISDDETVIYDFEIDFRHEDFGLLHRVHGIWAQGIHLYRPRRKDGTWRGPVDKEGVGKKKKVMTW